MRRFSSRYFVSLFRHGLIFGLIPAMIIGLILYSYAYWILTKRIEETAIQSHQNIQMRAEQMLQMQDRQLFNFLKEPLTEELMKNWPENSNFQKVNQVYTNMSKVLVYDLGINSCILVNTEKGWMIDLSGLSKLSEVPGGFYYEEILTRIDNMTWYVDFEMKNSVISQSTSLWLLPKTIKLIRPYPINSLTPEGYVSISIPCAFYNDLLHMDDSAEEILIIDPDGMVVSSKTGNSNGMFLSDTVFAEASKELPLSEIQTEGVIGSIGAKRLYSYKYSQYNGWLYLYIVDTSTVREELNFLRNITLSVGLLVLLGVSSMALRRAHSIYRPVDQLYDKISRHESEQKPVTPKTLDEFVAIDEHLDKLLSSRSKLEESVMIQSQLGRELFVHKLINGEIPHDEVNEKMQLYRYFNHAQWYRVVLMQMDSLEDTPYGKEDRDWLLIALCNVTAELMAELLCFPVIMDGGNIVMVIRANDVSSTDFRELLFDKLTRLQSEIFRVIHVDVTMCISKQSEDYALLSECYLQARELFKYQMKYSLNGVLFAEEMEEPFEVHIPFPLHLEEALLSALQHHNSEETDRALKIFIETILGNDQLRRSCYLSFSRLLVDILRVAQEYEQSQMWPLLTQGDAFEQLFSMKDVRQTFYWFKKNCTDPLIEIIRQRISTRETKLYFAMKEMAETRYDEDLSVEICAEEFSTNASYLRRLFKRGSGQGFTTYLTACRIEEAKKMLLATDMRISDIATKLTYQNSQNFIRLFRKIEGITPGEYRKINSSGKKERKD